MEGITARFLEEIAEAVEALGAEPERCFLNPSIALGVAVALASTASFASTLLAPLLVLAFSVILAVALRVDLRAWAKPVAFVAFIAAGVSVPLPFIVPGEPVAKLCLGPLVLEATWSGVLEAASLIARAVAASAAFTALLLHLGWRRLLDGLRGLRVPEDIVFLVGLYIKYVPIFLREAATMLAAREARLIKPSRKLAWNALASVVGELVLRGYHRAWRLEKALKARCFAEAPGARRASLSLGAWDAALICSAIALAALTMLLEARSPWPP